MLRAVMLGALLVASMDAQMCTGNHLSGPYALQLSGLVTISGTQAPAVGIASLKFSYDGAISGSSSVNFNGWLLGNPITGSYELRPDCTLLLSLRDDSGAFQHFSGTVGTEDGRISMRQTDTDTGERGILRKSAEDCSASQIREAYSFTLSGTATPLATGATSRPVSIAGSVRRGAGGELVLVRPVAGPVPFEVQSDCVVKIELPPFSDTANPVHLRGILVGGGSEILAIQTDPGEAVAAVFVAR